MDWVICPSKTGLCFFFVSFFLFFFFCRFSILWERFLLSLIDFPIQISVVCPILNRSLFPPCHIYFCTPSKPICCIHFLISFIFTFISVSTWETITSFSIFSIYAWMNFVLIHLFSDLLLIASLVSAIYTTESCHSKWICVWFFLNGFFFLIGFFCWVLLSPIL